MKKLFLFFIICSLFVITGCNNESMVIIEYKEDYGDINQEEITYKFTGLSEHFAFETGKVYYGNNNERYYLFKNFRIIKKIDKIDDITSYKIDLKFNGKSMFTDEMEIISDKNFNDIINNIEFEENGRYSTDGYGESDAFVVTTKDNFKDYVNLEIKYCYIDGECIVEPLEFSYVEN